MKKVLSAMGMAFSAVLLIQSNASAQTEITTTTYGGHTYELWSGNLPWATAQADAVADGGYLAVLTTSAETTAVYNGLIGNDFFTQPGGEANQAWLGGQTADGSGSTDDASNWTWVDGETWNTFDMGNFAAGEPNGDSEGLAINRYGTPEWNDEGGYVGGFIVEVNGVPDSGSTMAMLGGAFALVGAFGRKFRK